MAPTISVRRRPRVRIAVLGEQTTLIEPESVVSVQTEKTLGSPAGAFDVVLKPQAEEGMRRNNALYRSPLSPLTDRWLELIRPMSIIYIALGTDADLAVVDDVFQQVKRGDVSPVDLTSALSAERRSVVQQAVVMAGIIEYANTDIVVTPSGPQKSFHLAGKDLSKLLLDDGLRIALGLESDALHETNATGMVLVGSQRPGKGTTKPLDINNPETEAFLTRILPQDPKSWFAAVSQGNQATVTLGDALPKIVDLAPSQHVQLANGRAMREYLPVVNVEDSLKTARVQPFTHFYFHQGSTWDALNLVAPRPIAEVFLDTVGFGAQLVVRRPPFLRPAMMDGADQLLEKVLQHASIPKDTWSATWTRPLVGAVDQFTSEPLRVVSTPAHQAYHVVRASEIVSVQWMRGDNDAMTQYQVVAELAAQGPPLAQPYAVPIATDVPQSMRYGTRPGQFSCPWWSDQAGAGLVASPDGTPVNYNASYALSCVELVRLYYYFRDNPEFYSGSLTILGRPEIRIGDRLFFPDFGLLVYVEKVRQSYTMGQQFVTQISMTRGQPKDATRRLVSYDQDPPV